MSSLGVPFKSWVRLDRNIAGDLEGQIKEPIMIESSNKPLLHLRQLGHFFFGYVRVFVRFLLPRLNEK